MDAVSSQNSTDIASQAVAVPKPPSPAETARQNTESVTDQRDARVEHDTRQAVDSSKQASDAQTQQDSVSRQPVIAVRSGPAPVENLQADAERTLRATLNEHSTLRRVGEVLSIETPTSAEEPETELRLPGEGSKGSEQDFALPGDPARRSEAAPPPPMGAGRVVSTAATQAERTLEARDEQNDLEREQRREELQPGTEREREVRSTAVASNTGAVQNPDDPRRAELPGDQSEPATAAVAEAEFTRAGLLGATRDDDIVTRFFESTEPELESGPEPRPEQKLGERSVPFSTYA